ncbi:uncharacterized mitochondrial protein AtMg00310-like [Cannabis sativa]|uniref:uncharacterized mitochondrial protein AtMg00310-like n=1 Tax=Cannabis sativa TaxID=3483 RepID=UPI0029CA9D38|nr:uncharacterized mitochondrial protein AtMg00310-like [Cannabis sativa]
MEADEDHHDFFIMGATSAIARVMIMDLSRVIPRGYWFYLYKARSRYFPNSSILEVVPGHNPFYAWRSILWERDLMASGLIWKIGDGENILTIGDHWLPNNKYLCYRDDK